MAPACQVKRRAVRQVNHLAAQLAGTATGQEERAEGRATTADTREACGKCHRVAGDIARPTVRSVPRSTPAGPRNPLQLRGPRWA